ncbi:uncharacterized protein PV09_01145 [Verruconis gallopava]|uniref:HlyIII-domain-containing protein n=1 Tax=Verruconis gallopava TaxID=253628 RepID=A0A0D1Z5F7_9PEZI|nr:uncharacterized protein PV09_01145 [Verruconis gallopava]KIW08217.1 hypothetical protein PV09_01145 [Verruconis gallopava]
MPDIRQAFLKLEKAAGAELTLLWHEIEEWQRDNVFIRRGYRPASNSFKKSAKSLAYLHNETVNIYTHLIGAVVSALAFFWLYSIIHPRYESATTQDVLVFSCFFLGATACLGLSAAFHLFSNHSRSVQVFGNQLDYLGIVFLIWGSFIPSIYYGFQRDPQLITKYWIMITTIGAMTATATLMPVFRTPTFRPIRALMFVGMGLSAIFPVLHGLQIYGYSIMKDAIGFDWLLTQGILYILGASIYAARVPERFAPGRFDIWGSSHQIFHVLVLIAAATHLRGLLTAFDFTHRGPS